MCPAATNLFVEFLKNLIAIQSENKTLCDFICLLKINIVTKVF